MKRVYDWALTCSKEFMQKNILLLNAQDNWDLHGTCNMDRVTLALG